MSKKLMLVLASIVLPFLKQGAKMKKRILAFMAFMLLGVAGLLIAEQVQPWMEPERWLYVDASGNPDDTSMATADSIYTRWLKGLGDLPTECLAWGMAGRGAAFDSARLDVQFCFKTIHSGTYEIPDTTWKTLWIEFHTITTAHSDSIGFWPLNELMYLSETIGWVPVPWVRVKVVNLGADSIWLKWAAFYGAGLP